MVGKRPLIRQASITKFATGLIYVPVHPPQVFEAKTGTLPDFRTPSFGYRPNILLSNDFRVQTYLSGPSVTGIWTEVSRLVLELEVIYCFVSSLPTSCSARVVASRRKLGLPTTRTVLTRTRYSTMKRDFPMDRDVHRRSHTYVSQNQPISSCGLSHRRSYGRCHRTGTQRTRRRAIQLALICCFHRLDKCHLRQYE